jgi:hypothetical protein
MYHIIQTEKGFIMGTSIELVLSMKNANMFTAPQPKMEYMESVSGRVKELYLTDIRHDCAAHFLADLDQAGLIDLNTMQ